MSLEATLEEEEEESCEKLTKNKKKLQRCVEICMNLKDRKILFVAHGIFVFSLGVVLTVGHYAIGATTSSTVHTETSIPTVATSVVVILSGLLFTSLLFKKHKYLIFITIILSTVSGILAAIGAVHYGITVSDRLTALSDCMYTIVQRVCTCSVVTSYSRVIYNFEETISCGVITKHLREVAYGMCGVYAVTFVACFAAAVYGILLAHKIEIRNIKSRQQEDEECAISEKCLKQPFEDDLSDDFSSGESTKCGLPWRQDAATQTGTRGTGNDASCRHQCRHFVEVTVPDTSNDFVVNITKTRDPPPPYCETVYT